jgi:hypothetical protein
VRKAGAQALACPDRFPHREKRAFSAFKRRASAGRKSVLAESILRR